MNNDLQVIGTIVQILLLCIQIPTLIALIVYVIKTWEMASASRKSVEVAEKSVTEMKISREKESEPYVIVYFDIPVGKNIIYLVVKNIGKTIATNVKISFEPGLIGGRLSEYCCTYFRDNIIPSLPPNFEIRPVFDNFLEYLSSDHPMRYKVNIEYQYPDVGIQKRDEYILDLNLYRSMPFTEEKDMNNLYSKLEDVRKTIASLSQHLENIVSAIEEDKKEKEQ